jgi:hypothetical protein
VGRPPVTWAGLRSRGQASGHVGRPPVTWTGLRSRGQASGHRSSGQATGHVDRPPVTWACLRSLGQASGHDNIDRGQRSNTLGHGPARSDGHCSPGLTSNPGFWLDGRQPSSEVCAGGLASTSRLTTAPPSRSSPSSTRSTSSLSCPSAQQHPRRAQGGLLPDRLGAMRASSLPHVGHRQGDWWRQGRAPPHLKANEVAQAQFEPMTPLVCNNFKKC